MEDFDSRVMEVGTDDDDGSAIGAAVVHMATEANDGSVGVAG